MTGYNIKIEKDLSNEKIENKVEMFKIIYDMCSHFSQNKIIISTDKLIINNIDQHPYTFYDKNLLSVECNAISMLVNDLEKIHIKCNKKMIKIKNITNLTIIYGYTSNSKTVQRTFSETIN